MTAALSASAALWDGVRPGSRPKVEGGEASSSSSSAAAAASIESPLDVANSPNAAPAASTPRKPSSGPRVGEALESLRSESRRSLASERLLEKLRSEPPLDDVELDDDEPPAEALEDDDELEDEALDDEEDDDVEPPLLLAPLLGLPISLLQSLASGLITLIFRKIHPTLAARRSRSRSREIETPEAFSLQKRQAA
jgi:hypothetical protein